MSIHGTRIFTIWIRDTLLAGSVAAGIGVKPSSTTAGAGWCVVYPIAGGTIDGTLGNPNDDATPDTQVTSVGSTPDQTLWLVDRVRTLLLAAVPVTLSDGRRVTFVEPSFAEPTLLRDSDVSPPNFYSPDRFSYRTTPG